MKAKTMMKVNTLLVIMIGLALSSSLVSPALAISPGETVDLHVSADPDIWDHANAHATLYFYRSGYDHYISGDFYFAKASIGGAIWYLEIGKEFTIIETNFPTPEHHITVAWHPWWLFGFPTYGEGSRMWDDEPFLPVYYASYHFVAKRTDYSTSEVWVELMACVRGEMGSVDIDYDWQSLSLPPRPSGGGGCPILSVYDGEEYVEEGLLDIHNPDGVDVITEHTLTTEPSLQEHKFLLRLTEHPQTHSYIDRVQLIAKLRTGKSASLPLISAVHSEHGNVKMLLQNSDDRRTDTLGANLNNGKSEFVDLAFSSLEYSEIENLTFVIEGHNMFYKV